MKLPPLPAHLVYYPSALGPNQPAEGPRPSPEAYFLVALFLFLIAASTGAC
jgi:hypothetical protein